MIRAVHVAGSAEWGGGGFLTRGRVTSEPSPFHGFPQSIELALPPLSVLVLAPEHSA